MWKRAIFKIKFRKAINILKDDILIYGTDNDFEDSEDSDDENDKLKSITKLQALVEPVDVSEIPWYVIRHNC